MYMLYHLGTRSVLVYLVKVSLYLELAEAMCIDAIVSVISKGRKTPGFRTNDGCLRVKVSDLITLTGH